MKDKRNWKLISSEPVFNCPIFRVKKDKCELPDGRVMPSYYSMDCAEWVNVVAITAEQKMVLVRQYRHSIQRTTLEFPGGAVERGEDLKLAALRELREETGYVAGDITLICSLFPNPAIQSNQIHTYLAKDCRLSGPQEQDPFEDLEVVVLPIDEAVNLALTNEEMTHALIVAGMFRALRALDYPIVRSLR